MKTFLSDKSVPWVPVVYSLLILGIIASISILAAVPPVSRDALTQHLTIPKLYLQHGGIYQIPNLVFSYNPMNLDLLYLIPLYFHNDILPKFIHFAFALATAIMIFRYLNRRINVEYALLGSLFFLSIPVIVRLSSTAYVDLGLICFLFASLLYLFKWIETDFRIRYLVLSAVFCGLALGTKYNGLVGLFLLGSFVPFLYSRYHAGKKILSIKAFSHGTLFVIVALILFSPWMMRNYIWTKNPIYPLYNSFFNKEKPSHLDADNIIEKRDRMSQFFTRREVFGESWLDIALIPIRVFFQGKDDNPQYFDGKLNPFLLFLPIFAFLGGKSENRQEKTEKSIMVFFSILFLLFCCAKTSIRIRYFSPILPALVILSMYGIYNIRTVILDHRFSVSEHFKKIVIFLIVTVMLGLNSIYVINLFKKDQPLLYISGKITRDQYIQAFRPEYASFQYANKNLNKNDKILGLFIGNRGYYSNIPIGFKIELLQDYAALAHSGHDVAKYLTKKGFDYLLVNLSLFNFWVQKYSLHERLMLKQFFDTYTVKKFEKDGCELLKIND